MKLRLIKHFRHCNLRYIVLPPEGVAEVGWRTSSLKVKNQQRSQNMKRFPNVHFKITKRYNRGDTVEKDSSLEARIFKD